MKKSFWASIILTLSLLFGGMCVYGTYAAYTTNHTETAVSFSYEQAPNVVYDCFVLEDAPNAVSIAWGGNRETLPNPLSIPSSVEDDKGVNYNVKAIAASGFANTAVKSVIIPKSVDEIKPQAFLCCTSMVSISLPYGLERIQTSTFMDCSSLETITYRDRSDEAIQASENIVSLEDHAFTNCSSIRKFSMPTNLNYIGESCFENCKNLGNFFLPKRAMTVKSYAFRNCSNMVIGYIPKTDEGSHDFGDFVFEGCTKLTIYTSSTELQGDPVDTSGDHRYRKLYTSETMPDATSSNFVPIRYGYDDVDMDPNYPGLVYSLKSGDIYSNSGKIKFIDEFDDAYYHGKTKYAVVLDYTGSEANVSTTVGESTYTLVRSGQLIIPETLDGFPLAILTDKCFQNHPEFTGVTFSRNLVKLQSFVFLGCTNIATVDFEPCKNLSEVGIGALSYSAENADKPGPQLKILSLELPSCLKLIDGRAFYNFNNATYLSFRSGPSDTDHYQLLAIGKEAFGRFGYTEAIKAAAHCELELPCSLDDSKASLAKTGSAYDFENNYAIAGSAFTNCYCFSLVQMCICRDAGYNHVNNSISLAPSCFAYCKAMKRFCSSPSLYKIGSNCFNECDILCYVYLYTDKSQTPKASASIWNETLFNKCPGAVVYLSGNLSEKINMKWAQSADLEEFVSAASGASKYENLRIISSYAKRGRLAYFTNVADYRETDGDDFICLEKSKNCKEPNHVHIYPLYGDAQSKVSGELHVLRRENDAVITNYRPDNGRVTKTLRIADFPFDTGDPGDPMYTPITEIASACFCNTNGASRFVESVVLPNTIKVIGERAFMTMIRDDSNPTGEMKKVTYEGAPVPMHDGIEYTNYCMLPNGLTTIGMDAFFQNSFEYVYVPSTVTKLDRGAFFVAADIRMDKSTNAVVSKVEEFHYAGNSDFSYDSSEGNLYRDYANRSMLISHPLISKTDTEMEILEDKNVTAVGVNGCNGTNLTKITLPSTLRGIYGYGITGNPDLVEVAFPSNNAITHLGAVMPDANRYGWDTNDANYDMKLCTTSNSDGFNRQGMSHNLKLETLDFTSFTNLEEIGQWCFYADESLYNLCGNEKFTISNYDNGAAVPVVSNSGTGILDLRASTSLTSIGEYAFAGCGKIDYAIYPNTTNGDKTIASKITINNYQFASTANKVNALISEVAKQACHKFTGSNLSPSSHYTPNAFNGENAYYYADVIGDLWDGDKTVGYWTYTNKANNEILIFDNYAEASAYFLS